MAFRKIESAFEGAADVVGVGVIGKATLSGVTGVIGGKSPLRNMNVRAALQLLFPNQLILEIVGARDQGANAPVSISVQQPLQCPAGTKPAGAQ